MKVTGIIVEYNPFHNGHKYHLEKARELTGCDILVAVCSGNFVQRGQPAIIDKWTRRKTAVENGVDLVVELPFPFAVQSAAYFGKAAVDILDRCGIDHLVFGSEINNLEELQEIASMSSNIDNFKENMARGYSYPASYGYMADSYGPNDILAISYLRALENHPEITPVSILRTNDYFSEQLQGEITSALSIRKALARGQDVSQYTVMGDQLKNYPSPSMDKLYPLIRTMLLTSSPEELREIFLMDEGIENHLIRQAEECYSYGEFLNNATTRRYTSSRIQRTLCHLLVHNTRQFMKDLPEYDIIRPLAYNANGQKYIGYLQENGVRVVNHFSQIIKPYRQLEYKAAAVYGMLMDQPEQEKILRGEICGPYPLKKRP